MIEDLHKKQCEDCLHGVCDDAYGWDCGHAGVDFCQCFDSGKSYFVARTDAAGVRGLPEALTTRPTACTCISVGPRGGKSCPYCLEFHAKYFPAFPGDPDWRLNAGAINRNSWGILADRIESRRIERVSDFQLEAAHQAVEDAIEVLHKLKLRREINELSNPTSKD